MEEVLTLHKRVEHSRLIQSDRQVELIYDLTSIKIKVENTSKPDVDGYLVQLVGLEGSNLKRKKVIDTLEEIRRDLSSITENDFIDQIDAFIYQSTHGDGQVEFQKRFPPDITWEGIEKLFTDLERTSVKSSKLGKLLDIFNYEYFLDYLGNDVLQEKVFFDEELHIRYSNRASEFQTGRVIEVLIRGIKEQGTGIVIRKATVVTSFRA